MLYTPELVLSQRDLEIDPNLWFNLQMEKTDGWQELAQGHPALCELRHITQIVVMTVVPRFHVARYWWTSLLSGLSVGLRRDTLPF